jgi:ABC-type multidrug transport system fused ATPase/permease subunit
MELRHVSFRYDYHGAFTLRDLNFVIEPGERVAIVGPSGAGKSTLVELLYGVREPSVGHIELDGVDVRDLELQHLRDQVATAAVPEAFNGTILDNVRLGRETVSLSEVRSALKRAALLDEILLLPDGIHTKLTSGGAPLSDGQVARLMLARAMAGRPRMLIIDELLDRLDRGVRDAVLRGACDRTAPWTLVVVTHDPEVADHCDRRIELHPTGTDPRNHEENHE